MGLAHDGSLGADMLLKLVVESGIERDARVRWSCDGRAGVQLLEALTCPELDSICAGDRPAEGAGEWQEELLLAI